MSVFPHVQLLTGQLVWFFVPLDYFFQVSILSQTEQAWPLLSQLFFSIEAFFMIELGHVYDHRGLA